MRGKDPVEGGRKSLLAEPRELRDIGRKQRIGVRGHFLRPEYALVTIVRTSTRSAKRQRKRRVSQRTSLFRHPEAAAKRPSKDAAGDAVRAVVLRGSLPLAPLDDGQSKHSRGAPAPEPCGVRSLSLSPTTRGSGAPRGASNQCPRRTCQCRHRPMRSGADARRRQVYASLLYAVRAPHLLRGALASRRSAAALATPVATSIGSAPGRVSWDPALAGVTRLRLSQSSALRADRSFCRTNGVQGRPGAGLRIPPAGAALAPASVRHRRRPSNERDGIGV